MQEEQEIAVRLYENKKYGTTYAKGMWHRALFNGSVEVRNPRSTYLVDYFNFADWCAQARHAAQNTIIEEVVASGAPTDNQLFSWVQRYNRDTKVKAYAEGFSRYDLTDGDMIVCITDPIANFSNGWRLQARTCRGRATNAPDVLATNTEIESAW